MEILFRHCHWKFLVVILISLFGYWKVLAEENPPPATTYEGPRPSNIPPFNISSNFSEKEGLDKLLHWERYDNRSIPPVDEFPLPVNVSVLLLTLASPDESSLRYEIEFLMEMVWTDLRLRYTIINETEPLKEPYVYDAMPMRLNPRKPNFLDALHHHDRVWKPDVYYVKHGDYRHNLDPVHLSLRIYPNGTIHFTTRRHFILSCQGNFPYFPFDDPECEFAIESVSYEDDRLNFSWHSNKGHLRQSPGLSKVNAYPRSNKTDTCNSTHERGDYSCLRVRLSFGRDRAFYFTTVFIPDIILVTSSMITFWLEWNAVPARIMLGVTTMLNFFTTSNSFRATLPVVSELTAMNIWDGFSMFFIYAALLEFVVVNYIGRKRPRRANVEVNEKSENKIEVNEPTEPCGGPSSPNKHQTTKDLMTCTACSPSPSTHPVNNSCPASSQQQQQQQPLLFQVIYQPFRQRIVENPIAVAKTIDVVSRIVFPSAYAIFLIFFFVKHLALQDRKDK